MDPYKQIDGVPHVDVDGEWVPLAGDATRKRRMADDSPPVLEARQPAMLPAERQAADLAREADDRWPDFTAPGVEGPVSREEYARSLAIVNAGGRVLREEWSEDYLEAKHANLAEEALAVMEVTPRHLRKSLGMPTTYRDFDREWGMPMGWASNTRRSARFEEEHVRNGIGVARRRGRLAAKFEESLERMVDSDSHTSGHANLIARIIGLTGDTDKDKFEGNARGGPVEQATPEDMAARWVGRLMETTAWKALALRVGDDEGLRALTSSGLAELFGGKPATTASRALDAPRTTVHGGGFQYERRPGSAEDAHVVEER